jgi:hypothetical protein
LNAYVLLNFVATLLLGIGLLAAGKSLSRGELAVSTLLVLWALLNLGGIFDHRRWAFPSELMRLPVTAAILSAKLPLGSWRAPAQVGMALAVLALALWILNYRREFDGAPQAASRVIAPPARHSSTPENASMLAAAQARDSFSLGTDYGA